MYNNTMGRTQIYLGDEDLVLLDRAERVTGASRSELIRRAIQSTYGGADAADRIAILRRTSGAWHQRRQSGSASVDRIRGDLEARLQRLGL